MIHNDMKHRSAEMLARLRAELGLLDETLVEVDGKFLKPSQCYRLGIDPAHVLFNTNCPDHLRKKVESILSKYFPHK